MYNVAQFEDNIDDMAPTLVEVEVSRAPDCGKYGFQVVQCDGHFESSTWTGRHVVAAVNDRAADQGIKVLDQIVQIGGKSAETLTHDEIVQALQSANHPVTMWVSRLAGQHQSNIGSALRTALRSPSPEESLAAPHPNIS